MKGYIFAAAVLGYIAGTLFAPRAGSQTRAEIKESLASIGSKGTELMHNGQELKDKAFDVGHDLLDTTEDTIHRVCSSLHDAKDTASEAFSELNKNIHEIADHGKKAFSA